MQLLTSKEIPSRVREPNQAGSALCEVGALIAFLMSEDAGLTTSYGLLWASSMDLAVYKPRPEHRRSANTPKAQRAAVHSHRQREVGIHARATPMEGVGPCR
jgi:hypothetical protein